MAAFDRALAEVRLRREREQFAAKLAAANQQLEKRVKELTTLAGIGKAVTAVTNLTHLFSRLLEAGLFVTEAEVGWLVLAEDSTGQNILRAGKNLPNLGSLRLNQPWDDGLSSLLMLSGEGLTLAGPALARLRAGQVVKAAVAVPLKARDKVIGVLVAGNKTGRPFTDRDQAMLTAVADYAVIGIVNAWLFQAMEARLHNLQQAYDAQVNANLSQDDRGRELARELHAPLLLVARRAGADAPQPGRPAQRPAACRSPCGRRPADHHSAPARRPSRPKRPPRPPAARQHRPAPAR